MNGNRSKENEDIVAALTGLEEAIPIEVMRQANLMVDRSEDKASPEQAAAWLEEQIDASAD